MLTTPPQSNLYTHPVLDRGLIPYFAIKSVSAIITPGRCKAKYESRYVYTSVQHVGLRIISHCQGQGQGHGLESLWGVGAASPCVHITTPCTVYS